MRFVCLFEVTMKSFTIFIDQIFLLNSKMIEQDENFPYWITTAIHSFDVVCGDGISENHNNISVVVELYTELQCVENKIKNIVIRCNAIWWNINYINLFSVSIHILCALLFYYCWVVQVRAITWKGKKNDCAQYTVTVL